MRPLKSLQGAAWDETKSATKWKEHAENFFSQEYLSTRQGSAFESPGPLQEPSSGRDCSLLPDRFLSPGAREAAAYPANGGLVGRPDFLALGCVAVGEDADDGIFVCAWWRAGTVSEVI